MRDQLGSRSGPVGVIETRHFEGKWDGIKILIYTHEKFLIKLTVYK